MKIQVVKMGEAVIEGYKHVICSDNYINLMDISDNECSEIMAQDVLDNFDYEKIHECLVALVGKLRLNGKIIVGGTDVRLFSRLVINSSLNEQEASQILSRCKSMSSLNLVNPMINSLGLNIETSTINGTHFEIVAKRG